MGASSWERSQEPFSPSNDTPHHHAARGFGQAFGLHPIPALTALGVNAVLFGGTVLTMGAARAARRARGRRPRLHHVQVANPLLWR